MNGAARRHKKVTAAVGAFQAACDLRRASTNERNESKEPLFHYTGEEALFKIIDSGQLWFSSIYHMDDTEELRFGFNEASS
jgi:hypothetical protein